MTALRGLIALLLLAIWTLGVGGQGPPPPPLRVHFIDVGQGDAVLIQSPSGLNVVYVAGEHPSRVRDYFSGLCVSHLGVA
ncbi:MAG: hypothetical protein ABW292_09425, partial [Vicinamibacterales bacterium]